MLRDLWAKRTFRISSLPLVQLLLFPLEKAFEKQFLKSPLLRGLIERVYIFRCFLSFLVKVKDLGNKRAFSGSTIV
jgi:hypothetical protein